MNLTMKNFIKTTCLMLAAACGMTGCLNNFEEYNTDPYAIYTAPPQLLFPEMIAALMYVQQNDSQMIDQMVGSLGGYFTLSNRWGGQNFDTFNASDDWNAGPFNTVFQDIYPNYFDIVETTKGSGHFFAAARLIKAAAMIRVADCYGPIPYSKVADGAFHVEYDAAEDVYKYIIEDLSEAVSVLYAYTQQYPTQRPLKGNDAIFDGDYTAWVRLANSLIMRVAMRTNNQEAFMAAFTHPAGPIVTNAQNAMTNPGVQGNPYQLAAASWGDLRSNSSIVDYLNGYADPRCDVFFTKSTFDATKYIGMRAGTAGFDKSVMAGYSQPKYEASSYLPVFVAAETKFLCAEAALKGWAVPETEKTYYEDGIRLSMQQYGVEAAAIDAYLADTEHVPAPHAGDPNGGKYNYSRKTQLTIAWDDSAAPAEKLERIITQKWIANYPMGLEGWAEFRRTGYPELAPAVDNLSGGVITDNFRGMRRLRYPYTEQNLNKANYDKGVALLGGKDDESVDLFWAKKN